MKGITYQTGKTDQQFELQLSFIEMHFLMNAISAYQHTSKFYQTTPEHQDGTSQLHDEMTELYCREPEKRSQVYFETLGQAIDAAIFAAKERGFEVEQYPLSGGMKVGETNRQSLELSKDGKQQRQMLHIQIYRMDSGRYELNHYIS